MNEKQRAITWKLAALLNQMHELGLKGGVYDGNFCVWPNSVDIEHNYHFFDSVDEKGIVIESKMELDGGAGC